MHARQGEIHWSSELAYVVGLIVTDGSLSIDGRHFNFTSNDIDLINTFKSCLGLKNKISKKKSGYTGKMSSFYIQFGNITLYKWLVNIGLMHNKTKRIKSLKIPDKYFFDFLRGHLDGDGTIRGYQDSVYKNSTRLYLSFMSASLTHLKWINRRIKQLLEISGYFRESNGACALTFGKHKTILIINKLYHKANVPKLERKFLIAEPFISPR